MEQDPDRIARRLTHDELTAAEDAYQGRPFNEACSRAAWRVYVGILVAKSKLHHERSTLGRPAPNHELLLLSMEDLVGAAAHGARRRRRGIQWRMRSCREHPLLVRDMAGGSRALLLSLPIPEDNRDRRPRFVSVGPQLNTD